MAESLHVGDQVRFATFDEWMTVDQIEGHWAICSWVFHGGACHGRFLLSILEKCERRTASDTETVRF